MLSIVVAYGSNRVIGVDGDLPWHLPTDMAFFREITMGQPVIMGRRTWESIPPKFRPLPGRRNLVLSRATGFAAGGAEVFDSLAGALAAAGGVGAVIGGGQTYLDALPSVDRIYATEVELAPDGDTFFPPLDPAAWRLAEERERVVEASGVAFTVRVYDRIPAA